MSDHNNLNLFGGTKESKEVHPDKEKSLKKLTDELGLIRGTFSWVSQLSRMVGSVASGFIQLFK